MGKVDLIGTGLIFDTTFEKLKTGLNKKRFIPKKDPSINYYWRLKYEK